MLKRREWRYDSFQFEGHLLNSFQAEIKALKQQLLDRDKRNVSPSFI
jgi:hypothetical protein